MTGETSPVFFTHSLVLGLQKALVRAITIKVLQAISRRLAALTILSNQSVGPAVGQQSRAELNCLPILSKPVPPLPRAKDGHARSSASAFLTFL